MSGASSSQPGAERLAPKHAAFAIASAGALVVDRATKALVALSLEPGARIDLPGGLLAITHVRNPGAAFGVLASSSPELRSVVFALAAAAALVVVLFQLRSLARGERREAIALGLVAGGALGNALDRLPFVGSGEVIDFLYVELRRGYDWPHFNVADIAIVVGMLALVVDLLAREAVSRSVDVDASQR